MAAIESAGITDVGRKRKNNEDSYLVDKDLGLFIVADGMGGHQAGEVASKIVVDTIKDFMRQSQGYPGGDTESGQPELSEEANRLMSSILLANRTVYEVSQSQESYQGMGSTVAAVYFTPETFVAANVGDSTIYLVHQGEIELISVLHTVMAEHAALNPNVNKEMASAFKHMLTRGMGIDDSVTPDVSESQRFGGDILVISSDGLTDKVDAEEIRDIVMEHPPSKACRALVDLANARGGDDNVTVIVLKIKSTANQQTGLQKAAAWFKETIDRLLPDKKQ